MSDSGWDEEYERAFGTIIGEWPGATPEAVDLLDQFAVEFYERFCAVLTATLESQIAALVATGLNDDRPDLLAPANAATLATALWLPPKLGTDLLSAYMELAMNTMWAEAEGA